MTLTAAPPKRDAPPALRLAGPRTRRLPWVALGLIPVTIGALVFGMLVQSAGERSAVVVTARPLSPGHVVADADLASIDVAVDGDAALVPAARRAELVGRRVVGSLPAGSLVGFGHFADGTGLEAGQVVVGAHLGPGALPVPNLRVGDRVRLLAAGGDDGAGASLGQASIYLVSPGTATGTQFVSLAVPQGLAPAVSDTAAAQRLRLVLEGADARPGR